MTNETFYDSSDPLQIFKILAKQNRFKNYQLLKVLIKKDFANRYQRSLGGIWWSLLNPTATAAVLYFVFHTTYSGKLTKGIAFGPYVLSGTLILTFLATGVVATTQTLQTSALIFTRLPSPPEIFALSGALVLSLNLIFGLVPLLIWNFFASGHFTFWIFLLPILIIFGCIFVTGLVLIFFSVVVRFGDAINVLVLGAALLTYLTPIFYPISSISFRAQFLLNLNPLTHFVNIFRKLTLDYGTFSFMDWLICLIVSVVTFIFGQVVHNKMWSRTVTLI